MSQACPLCGSEAGTVVGLLTRADLRAIWLRDLGIDPSAWVPASAMEYQHCSLCDLRYFDNGFAGPEEMYRQLETLPWYYLEYKPEFDIAVRNLGGAERILEIGAGAGAFGRLVSPQTTYVGLEFNASAAGQAVASGLDVRTESVAKHLASAPEAYDAVVSFQVMEHVAAVGDFIRECRSCLRPGGRLIVSVPAHDGFIGSELNSILDLPPHHLTQWSDKCLSEIAGLFDLTLLGLEHDDIAPYHRANYLHQKSLDRLGIRRTDARPVRASAGFRALDAVVRKGSGAWGRVRRPALPPGFGHSVTAWYELPAS
jgi:SAM-dependent methyltransferase